MVKRWKVFALFVFAFILVAPNVFAQLSENSTDKERVDYAYDCLLEKIDERGCSALSFEEKAFSLLSTGSCKAELVDHSRSEECWPKERCSIIGTSKALLALKSVGVDKEEGEDWIFERKSVPTDLTWYLQIDTDGPSTCSVSYGGREYTINLAEDKTIDASAGACLVKRDSDFWLNIMPNCYEEEFEIVCDEDYVSSFLFRETDSSTIHVSNEVTSRAADSKAIERIDSFCFGENGNCDYESSLWATLVLSHLGYDISNYAPYLIGAADYNKDIFSAPFLYLVTADSEYETEVLEKQINQKYWEENGNRYYDTALALLPFAHDDVPQKDAAIEWLFDVQGQDGCWDNGNIRNNGFLLYSVWPRSVTGISSGGDINGNETPDNDCVESGYSCVASVECGMENKLPDYDCSGYSICCGEEPEEEEDIITCEDSNGEICSEDEHCSLGSTKYTEDLEGFEKCCVGGTCKEITDTPADTDDDEDVEEEEYTCEANGGTCESYGCSEGYEATTLYECADYADCCVVESGTPDDSQSYWWIWVLGVLIVLSVIALIYKDEIQKYIDEKFGDKGKGDNKGGQGPRKPGFPSGGTPSYMRHIKPGMPQRKIIPKQLPPRRPPQAQNPQSRPKTPRELDDVLKKLKEISK